MKKHIGFECYSCKAIVDWDEIPAQCPNCNQGGTFWTEIFEVDGVLNDTEWVGKDGYVRQKSEVILYDG